MSYVLCQMSLVPYTMYYVPSPMFYVMFPLTCVLVLQSCSFLVCLSKASITLLISIIFHQRFQLVVLFVSVLFMACGSCFLFRIFNLFRQFVLHMMDQPWKLFQDRRLLCKQDLPPQYMVVKNCSPPDQIFLNPLWGIYCIWLYQLTVKTVYIGPSVTKCAPRGNFVAVANHSFPG